MQSKSRQHDSLTNNPVAEPSFPLKKRLNEDIQSDIVDSGGALESGIGDGKGAVGNSREPGTTIFEGGIWTSTEAITVD